MLKKLGLTLVALLATAGIAAYAAGAFQGYPLIGDTSGTTCLSNANPGMAVTCNQFRPAANSQITGNEQIPADTGSSTQPFTVLIPSSSLGAGPYAYNAPLTGATIPVTSPTRRLILEPAGTIATLTVTLPTAATLNDNQLFGLCTTQIVTALTVTAGSGTTVLNAPTALLVPVATGAGSCVEWVYRQSNTSWYRVQ
jgi:hypothetical protein